MSSSQIEVVVLYKIMGVIYLNNMATQEYIKKLEGIIKRVLERKPELTIKEITKLIEPHFTEKKPKYAQVAYVIKYLGYRRNLKGHIYEQVVKPKEVEIRTCMRCDTEKELKGNFKKYYNKEYGDIGFGNYLMICAQCVRDESKITGETIAELNGIYAYLQKKYNKVLDKSMYEKFWEPALGLR